MKKVTEKWKRHSRAVGRRTLFKRRQKRGLIKPGYHLRQKFRIFAPLRFNLMANHREFLSFCDEIETKSERGYSIFLDLSLVQDISLDALLYLLSHFEFLRYKLRRFTVFGNEPKNPDCRGIFKDSGFYNFVHLQKGEPGKINKNIFSIKSGEQVASTVASEVVKFTKGKLTGKEQSTKGIYSTLVELMNNTREHAYLDNSLLPKWWTAAYYNETRGRIEYVFLDNGQGIPTTVRKNFAEQLFGSLAKTDSELIQSALEGKFKRSRTKQAYRGKGLPQIYGSSKKSEIEDLRILSNCGFVGITMPDQYLGKKTKFRGTLFSWNLSNK